MTQTVTQPVAVQADYQRIPGNKAVATVQGAQPSGNGTGPAGEATWGYIIGSIDNQADLIARLDAKVDTVTYQAVVPPHIANTNNPHQVTKAQVGLDQVDNTSDANKPVSGPQKTYIDNGDAAANANANNRVLKAGDTMTGSLNFQINAPIGLDVYSTTDSPFLNLRKGFSTKQSVIAGYTSNLLRWQIIPGDSVAENGGNNGSNFRINRYDDSGTVIGNPIFNINRRNGAVTIGGGPARAASASETGNARLELAKVAGTDVAQITSTTNALPRWNMQLADATAESGSNAGSNFALYRLDDAGTVLGTALQIIRKNGYVQIGPGTFRAAALTDTNNGASVLELNKSAAGQGNYIDGNTNGSLRWQMQLADATAEAGSNAGSDFRLARFSDTQTPLANALFISRKNGQVTIGSGNIRAASISDPDADAALELSKPITAANCRITSSNNGVLRWSMDLGNSTAEGGSNTGSDFGLSRWSDAGAFLSRVIEIRRTTGAISIGPGSNFGPLGLPNGAWVTLNKNGAGNNSVLLGANNGLARWALELGSTDAESGGNAGSRFAINAYDDSGNYITTAFRIERNNRYIYVSNRIYCGEGIGGQQGSGGAQSSSVHNWYWTGSLQAWVDTTNVGNVTLTSDERVKQDVVAMPDYHAQFMAIRPKQYRWGDVGIFKDDGREYAGWSAQQLIECGFGHAVDGSITAVQENGDPQPASVQDRPILAQAVLEIQALHALVAELRAEINALKGTA